MATNITAKTIAPFIVISLSVFFAIFTGNSVADGNLNIFYFIVGLLLVIVAVTTFRERLFLWMIVGYELTGTIEILPIPFNVRQLLCIMAALYFFSDLILGDKKNKQVSSDRLNFWVYLNVGYLATVFARNPVGFAFLGGGTRVGGKPYIEVILSFMAYIILRNCKLNPKLANKIPRWLVAVAIFSTIAGMISVYFPTVGNYMGKFYSVFYPAGMGVSASDAKIYALNQFGVDRLTFLAPLGTSITLYVISIISPTNLIAPGNLRIMFAYIFAMILILLSGFFTRKRCE